MKNTYLLRIAAFINRKIKTNIFSYLFVIDFSAYILSINIIVYSFIWIIIIEKEKKIRNTLCRMWN